MSYDFFNTFRAQCINVVDGDTLDLLIDQGFHSYKKERIRLLGVNTPEIRAANIEEKEKAQLAKQFTIGKVSMLSKIDHTHWPLKIKTFKADSFGRFLAIVYYVDNEEKECDLSEQLIKAGLGERM